MHLLVTGFGPFPHVRVNPTTMLARAVARRLQRSGVPARALVLETSYRSGLPALAAALADEEVGAVLMLGVAARARGIRVERYGRGFASPLHPDVSGAVPAKAAASNARPLAATTSVDAALAALRRGGLVARLSPSAGRYLCDASYALALRAARGRPVLFVHVPWLRTAPGRVPKQRVPAFRPQSDRLAAALAEIGAGLARRARLAAGRHAP